MKVIITEQNGAEWSAEKTNQQGQRTYWVRRSLLSVPSQEKPGIVGFYASSIQDAKNKLNPVSVDRRIDGYNPEFLGQNPQKQEKTTKG